MSRAGFKRCVIRELRWEIDEELDLPPFRPVFRGQEETPAQFWERVAGAGLLVEALALYDELVAERKAWAQTTKETKKQFVQRIEREGRTAEMERVRAELLASGLTTREVQEELVEKFQPRDGSRTRSWPTPDPWRNGRLFQKKAYQDEVLAQVDEDKYGEEAVTMRRVWNAKERMAERCALAVARQWDREITEAGAQEKAERAETDT
jgi:hypothetical protein